MRQRVALAVVALAVFLTALDQTVVVTALVDIVRDVLVPITALDRAAWIVSGYLLGYVIAMPLMGRVADVYGRRRVFVICLVIFGLGSVVSALAPVLGGADTPDTSTLAGWAQAAPYWLAQQAIALGSHVGVDATFPALNVLVAGRFLQALGGGALVPVALAVASDAFGRERRGIALGIVGAVAEAGGVLGPMWGAWVTTTLGWQWIFWLNLPVLTLLIGAGVPALGRAERSHEPVDAIGALLFGAAIATLTLGLGAPSAQAGALSLGANTHVNPTLVAVAAALLAGFVALELWRRHPVVEMRLFRRPAFGAAALLSLLIGVALIVAMVDIPIFAATVLGWQPIASGLALLRLTALISVGALAGGWLTRWLGCRVPGVAGCAVTAAGLWLMHLWPVHVDELTVTVATTLAGMGFGLVIAPITTSAVNAAGAGRAASASAVVTVLRMVGMIVGLAALTAWGLSYFKGLMAPYPLPLPQPGDTAADTAARLAAYADHLTVAAHQVYTQVFAAAAMLCALAALPALLLWRGAGRSAPAAPGAEGVFDSYVAPLA